MSDMCLAAIEGHADAWAEQVNLNAMIENALSPMRLNRSAPDDVRASFAKRMREQVDAIVRQAWIEGAINGMDGFAPVEDETAKLKAAAPELLAALKGVLRVADRKTVEFDAARAAVAKAEGAEPHD